MKLIKLSQGKFAQVDDEDFEKVSNFTWSARKDHKTFYAMSGGIYKGVSTLKSLHRFIMDAPDGYMIDHIDGDGLNCQKINLRICTNAQNQWNRSKTIGSSSMYKGVSFKNNRYEVSIRVNNNRHYLGRFVDEKEAGLAYNSAAIKFHGEFANLNTI